MVMCTHMHVDHVGFNTVQAEGGGWEPTFPNAKYFFGREEYEHWQAAAKSGDGNMNSTILDDSIAPIVDAGLAEIVESDAVLIDEPGEARVVLMPTPGHTPGHVSVRIETPTQTAIITGDCIHHPIQIADVALGSSADTDADMAIQTRGALLDDLQGSETLLFGTHFATPSCGFVKQDKEGGGDYLLEVKHGDATADETKL